jgi:site-specific DNA recombinase
MRIMRRRRPTRLFSAAAPEPGALAESAQWYRRRGCALRAWVECAGRISADWAPRLPPILNNELYIGRIVWNRLRYVKDPETGKRISRLNGPDRWVVQDAPELRIIPQDLWEKAKNRQLSLKRDTRPDVHEKPFWARQRPRFLITGLAKCGECGSSYVKISANLLGCAAARNRGTCENRLNIRLDTLEEIILGGLRHRLMAPDLFKAFCEEFHRELSFKAC